MKLKVFTLYERSTKIVEPERLAEQPFYLSSFKTKICYYA
ncbi:unnamed protein product [Arabidopsis halleri]